MLSTMITRFALFPLRCVDGLQGRSAAAYRESAWLRGLPTLKLPNQRCQAQRFEIAHVLFGRALILQLSLRVGFALMALPVTVLGHGLMDAPPQRPAEEMIEHYAGRTLQAANELADLAHAEGDQRSRLRSPLLCDVTALSFTRRAARKPKASMASVMCRYQPCQERIS